MLKILKAEEPLTVEQLVIVVYGVPGLGKSTIGFSSDEPLLMDFDGGAYRAAIRGDSVQINSWPDVTQITADDLKSYKTVIVDTAGRALDYLTTDIIKRNPKMGYGGALTLQGYGALKAEFTSWLKMLRQIGKDVILIAHSAEDKNGDDLIERIDVQGGSKGEIYKSADAMGRLYLRNGQRVLNFSPTDAAFGKNPGNLEPLIVPEITSTNSFMADVIDNIKDKLNTLSEIQQERQNAIEDWVVKIAEANTADHYNHLVKEIKKADKEILQTLKSILHKTAIEHGFKYDKKEGYVEATNEG